MSIPCYHIAKYDHVENIKNDISLFNYPGNRVIKKAQIFHLKYLSTNLKICMNAIFYFVFIAISCSSAWQFVKRKVSSWIKKMLRSCSIFIGLSLYLLDSNWTEIWTIDVPIWIKIRINGAPNFVGPQRTLFSSSFTEQLGLVSGISKSRLMFLHNKLMFSLFTKRLINLYFKVETRF